MLKLNASVTYSNPNDSSDNLETILKVCMQLCKDGILRSTSNYKLPHFFNRWSKLKYKIDDDTVVVYSCKQKNLTSSECSKIICRHLESYCFDCEYINDKIWITFNRTLDDNFSTCVEDSLSKILKH